jgi:pimeloyl-ACP methyl ester carboxylesterase
MLTWRRLQPLRVSLCVLGAACTAQPLDSATVQVAATVSPLLKIDCTDSIDSVYDSPGEPLSKLDQDTRGQIVRCAQGDTLDKEVLQEKLSEAGFYDVQVKNKLRLFRISYRTERATGLADVASALVVVPLPDEDDQGEDDDGYRHKRAEAHGGSKVYKDDDDQGRRDALVVYGHGTAPYRQDCGPSRADPLTSTFAGEPDRELRTVLALAVQGWPVIATDYAGYVKGSPAPGYMFAEDEAYSVLDATRAAKKLLEKVSEQVVLVGHSQGGHAVLSAQAYAPSYGVAGRIAGVVAFAPFWAPARGFGVITFPESGYSTADDVGAYALNSAVEYFYTHGEVLDGKSRGDDVLTFEIPQLIGNQGDECSYFPPIAQFGTTGADLFKPDFQAVSECAALGERCLDPLAVTWSLRFAADRPTLDRSGAPVLMWQGAQDPVVPVSIAGCAVDKIRQDGVGFKLCADPDAEHELVESNNAAHVIQWIKARTEGAPEPTQSCGDQAVLEGLDCFIGNFD